MERVIFSEKIEDFKEYSELIDRIRVFKFIPSEYGVSLKHSSSYLKNAEGYYMFMANLPNGLHIDLNIKYSDFIEFKEYKNYICNLSKVILAGDKDRVENLLNDHPDMVD